MMVLLGAPSVSIQEHIVELQKQATLVEMAGDQAQADALRKLQPGRPRF